MPQPPIRYYRLWCAKKRHSHWLADREAMIRLAVRKELAYADRRGNVSLGPLSWIEHGERARSKTKTISLGNRGFARR